MEGNNSQNIITSWDFLAKDEAGEIFGKLDYLLKDGMHIQNVNGQYFTFLEINFLSLKKYYKDFFGLHLAYSGDGSQKYYYLEFNINDRGSVPVDHRSFMKNEFVILGFLIYKVLIIDRNFELTSVKQLQSLIKHEYEEYKPNLYRLLAKARKENSTQLNDDRLDELIEDALTEFRKIGWIEMEGDFFDTLPAFERLNKVYADYINDMEELLLKNG